MRAAARYWGARGWTVGGGGPRAGAPPAALRSIAPLRRPGRCRPKWTPARANTRERPAPAQPRGREGARASLVANAGGEADEFDLEHQRRVGRNARPTLPSIRERRGND